MEAEQQKGWGLRRYILLQSGSRDVSDRTKVLAAIGIACAELPFDRQVYSPVFAMLPPQGYRNLGAVTSRNCVSAVSYTGMLDLLRSSVTTSLEPDSLALCFSRYPYDKAKRRGVWIHPTHGRQ